MKSEKTPKHPRTVAELIEALGGSRKVADQLGISQPGVCNWSKRDLIALAWRPDMQKLADEAGLLLKDDWFVDPTKKIRRPRISGAA